MKRSFICSVFALGCVVSATVLLAADEATGVTNLPPSTNSVGLELLVAEVLERNPELSFYRAEIAAAKGERRTAITWANPELSTQLGPFKVLASVQRT